MTTYKYGQADPHNVRVIVNHLLKDGSFEAIMRRGVPEGSEIRYVDLLMAAHNFHKQIVDDLARRWQEEQGVPARLAYRMAKDTWAGAMDDRIRDGLPPETITEEHQDTHP